MQAERLILETDEGGNLKQVPKLPPNQQFEVIFRLLPEATESSIKRRTPHPDLAGKVQVVANNIIDSVPDSDWALPQRSYWIHISGYGG